MTEDQIAERLAEVMVFDRIGAKGFLDKLKSIGLRVIEDQPDHIVEFRPDGWQIQHSIECRTQGKLLDCDIHKAVEFDCESSPTRTPEFLLYGRYRVSFNDQGETFYEKLDEGDA